MYSIKHFKRPSEHELKHLQLKGLPVVEILKRFYPVLYCGYIYDLKGEVSPANILANPAIPAEEAVEHHEKHCVPTVTLLLFDR